MAARCNQKYRGATKDGQRGANINIVAQQKMAARCNQKYRGATKDGQRGEIKNIVARRTFSEKSKVVLC
jgi:hypothetical protein